MNNNCCPSYEEQILETTEMNWEHPTFFKDKKYHENKELNATWTVGHTGGWASNENTSRKIL